MSHGTSMLWMVAHDGTEHGEEDRREDDDVAADDLAQNQAESETGNDSRYLEDPARGRRPPSGRR